MIWICTFSLLFLAAWLFFNAVNERRWVQAHSHDATVASDEGLLPSFTLLTGTGSMGGDSKVSIGQENSGFAKAVSKVQEKTAKLGDYFESKVAASRISDPDQRPRSITDEDTFFGRAVASIGEKTAPMGAKLDIKVKEASSMIKRRAAGFTHDESAFARASRQVAATSDEISKRVASGAKNLAGSYAETQFAKEQSSLFGKVVGKVSGSMEKIESKFEAKMAKAKPTAAEEGDLMTRVASKVGKKVNEMDSKLDSANKNVASELDKS